MDRGYLLSMLVAQITDGKIVFTDIGSISLIGGILGESMARFARSVGVEPDIDGWREGMFIAGLAAFAWWVSGQMGA